MTHETSLAIFFLFFGTYEIYILYFIYYIQFKNDNDSMLFKP